MDDSFASVAGPGAEGTRKNSRWLAAATARLSDFITMAGPAPPRALGQKADAKKLYTKI